jgi:hypothetical protein
MKMQYAPFPACLPCLACLAFSGVAVGACAAQGDGSATEQSMDPLLDPDGGPLTADGGHPCAACIQQSCASELTALETELKTLRTEASSAFTCVRDNKCLSLFWTDRDAGGRAAVSACIAACNADAGLPDRDAAVSTVRMLAGALDTCVDSSCAMQCPGAANDRDDRDGGFPGRPAFDGSFPPPPSFDGGFPKCDGGFPPFPHFDGGAAFPPPRFGDGGFVPPPFGARP